jgi:hypothetical protein
MSEQRAGRRRGVGLVGSATAARVFRCAVAGILGLSPACTPAGSRNGAESPAPPQGTFATPVVLAAAGESPVGYGLTGVNKPNGAVYRFRESVPPTTPDYVQRQRAGLDLKIADPTDDGWLAFYKGPLPDAPRNAAYRAVLYGPGGGERWELDLNRLLSAESHLEIQDIRYRDGQLYFNEACQSYAREAGGECSALVRVDAASGAVVWRTHDLVSNNIFLLHGPYVVAGYGFTNEPDALHLVSRDSGRTLDTLPLASAHSYLEFRDGKLYVLTYDGALTVTIEE